MKLEAYLGVCTEYPKHTMDAFCAAAEQNYDGLYLHAAVTKDGHWLAADASVNELTYPESRTLDVGGRFHRKFAGAELPLLADVLEMAREEGLSVRVAVQGCCGEAAKEKLKGLLLGFGAELVCPDPETLREAAELLPELPLHYDGPVTEETLPLLRELTAGRLTVWLPSISHPMLKEAAAFASVGIGPVSDYGELEQAAAAGVTMVSTMGQLKPEQNVGVLADMHFHSRNSHDAKYPVAEMCEAIHENGVSIMAVSDHCDAFYCWEDPNADIYSNICDSHEEARLANARMDGRCRVLTGIELGEGFWAPEQAARLLGMLPFDVVVGSVHAVRLPSLAGKSGLQMCYSQIDFQHFSEAEMEELLNLYFDDVLTMVETMDIDIMAHLTSPIGYPRRRLGKWINVHPYAEKIDRILRAIIRKGIAMEVNTHSFMNDGALSPEPWIIARYRELGGYLITLGSDAHAPQGAAAGFRPTVQLLKELGFRCIFYYEGRRSYPCTL